MTQQPLAPQSALQQAPVELEFTALDAVSAGLNKVGTGTLTLSSANTYRGTTTVSSGILV